MADENEGIVFNDSEEWFDADYQVTPRETKWIQSEILEVNRMRAVAQKHFPTVQIGAGTKEWYVYTDVETEPVKFDDDFLTEDQDESRSGEQIFYPAYMHKDYKVSMVDADAVQSGNKFHSMGLPQRTIRNFTGTVADYREKVIWRGYDISGRASAANNDQGVIDTKVVGILNTSGINTFHAGTADADITNAGDGMLTVAHAAASLITDGFYGPYDFFMTPMAFATYLANVNATTDVSDIQLMRGAIDVNGSRIVKSISLSKHLIPTVEASGTESVVCAIDTKDQNGKPTILIGEAYPLHGMVNSPRAAVAASGKIVWAGCAGVLKAEAIAWDENITY